MCEEIGERDFLLLQFLLPPSFYSLKMLLNKTLLL